MAVSEDHPVKNGMKQNLASSFYITDIHLHDDDATTNLGCSHSRQLIKWRDVGSSNTT